MKKLFVLVLVAMVSTVTFAQISWNAKAGINMSKLTGGEGADMKVGYQLGVGMEYAFTDMWSVQKYVPRRASPRTYRATGCGTVR